MNNWQIDYKTIIINNKNVASFCLLPGVRGWCNSGDHKITIYRYVIGNDLVLPAHEIDKLRTKIFNLHKSEPVFLAHEKHHAQNHDNKVEPVDIANNIYEYMGLRCMEEASAYAAGNLVTIPKSELCALKAAIKGTEEFFKKKEFYMNQYERYLYSSVVFFDTDKPAHKMVQKGGIGIFKESYSDEFNAALSAYFTFDGYALFQDRTIRHTPEWAQLCENSHKIKSFCVERATIIANEVLKRSM